MVQKSGKKPVEVGSCCQYSPMFLVFTSGYVAGFLISSPNIYQGFSNIPSGWCRISEPSTVVGCELSASCENYPETQKSRP